MEAVRLREASAILLLVGLPAELDRVLCKEKFSQF